MKKLLYVSPLLFLIGCAGSQKYTSWQKTQSDIATSNENIQTRQIQSKESIHLSDRLVKIIEIKERNKTARAFSSNPDYDKNCEKEKVQVNKQQYIRKNYTKGKGSKNPSNLNNPDNDLVLEGMDIMTSELAELADTIEGITNNKSKQIQCNSGLPITINANGATGGITINVGSPGAVAENDNSKKEIIPVKKSNNTLPLMSFIQPPKSVFENFFEDFFGLGNNIVNITKENAGLIGLSLIGYEQAKKDTHYENNNGRSQAYDYSDRSNKFINYIPFEEQLKR
jgi:hypothetical protein